ncbi:hypothetical protein BSNK01_13050 [Bacillaceae bacterium]
MESIFSCSDDHEEDEEYEHDQKHLVIEPTAHFAPSFFPTILQLSFRIVVLLYTMEKGQGLIGRQPKSPHFGRASRLFPPAAGRKPKQALFGKNTHGKERREGGGEK